MFKFDWQFKKKKEAKGSAGFQFHNTFFLEAFDADGNLKWDEEIEIDNLVVTEGRNDILNIMFGAKAKTADWWLGLIENSTAPVPSDTLASHGFDEYKDYTGDRKVWSTGTASNGTIDTSSPTLRAEFDFIETVDITGLLLCDQETGDVGVLFSAALLVSAKTLNNGDTLRVGYRVNATSA